ncbi:MAG: winged helix-turn-helix transcriptional regulator [Pseudonocardiaceae bacterium]|nr:winged helix-turn-helix transcriptional regulator [Pseudonocardiaceae bacterium]
MNTPTLRTPERDGGVRRTVHPVAPPWGDYCRTPLGRTLHGTVCDLVRWAVAHADEIDEARAACDRQVADRAG